MTEGEYRDRDSADAQQDADAIKVALRVSLAKVLDQASDTELYSLPLLLILADRSVSRTTTYTAMLDLLKHSSSSAARIAIHGLPDLRKERFPSRLGPLRDLLSLQGDQEEIGNDFRITILNILADEHPDILKAVLAKYIRDNKEVLARSPRSLVAIIDLLEELTPTVADRITGDEIEVSRRAVASMRLEQRRLAARLARLERLLEEFDRKSDNRRSSSEADSGGEK